jgi:hypothetical protein
MGLLQRERGAQSGDWQAVHDPNWRGQGMMGGGMMASCAAGPLFDVDPLTLTEAEAALEDYLRRLGGEGLAIGEIMIFDNHAYAQLFEADTGVGAVEVLIDPVTGAVYPEHGPNMMWNLKYSPMDGYQMMGRWSPERLLEPTSEMPVTPEEAVRLAQRYLDRSSPGAQAGDHPDTFYGYYTLHILQEDATVGMLSINGYTGEVLVHGWHGELIEMSEQGE